MLDAYRREILSDHELGLGNTIHINAYRIAGLIPGGLSLYLAAIYPWETVFFMDRTLYVSRHLHDVIFSKRAQNRHAAN